MLASLLPDTYYLIPITYYLIKVERRRAEDITSVLQRFLRDAGLESPLNEYRLIEAWPKVVGEGIAKRTAEIYIRNQTLCVRLTTPALRANIMMERQLLVEKLNAAAGAGVITDIQLI